MAILTALLGLVASFAVVWYERRVPNHRSIGYRVQMDTAIGDDHRDGRPGPASARLGLFNDLPDMSDATLVLLRVENDGAMSISETDYTSRDQLRGLTAVFTGRTVRGVSVTQSSDAEHLMEYFTAVGGMAQGGGSVHLPRVPLNRGQHYKLLVLLTGGGVGNPVRLTGGIRDGAVTPTGARRSTTPAPVQQARPLDHGAAHGVRDDPGHRRHHRARGHPSPLGCAKGTLTVVGSTALRPAATDLAEDYTHDCPGSHVGVRARGSNEGLRELSRAGRRPRPAPPRAHRPVRRPGSGGLTAHRRTDRAGRLRAGRQRAGHAGHPDPGPDPPDLPRRRPRLARTRRPRLPIRLVSRDADSGTRELFRRKVLGGQAEPAFTSRDCATKNADSDRVVRCELDSTPEVLKTVADTPAPSDTANSPPPRPPPPPRGCTPCASTARRRRRPRPSASGYPSRRSSTRTPTATRTRAPHGELPRLHGQEGRSGRARQARPPAVLHARVAAPLRR
ncbi:phosphate ABC transporter substrate-binding protein [Streptomyces sp. M19]